MTSFGRVQVILDSIVAEWARIRERPANLRRHGPQFSWHTKDELLKSVAFGKQLITTDDVANKAGERSNLIIALRIGVAPYPRMPRGGPYLSDPEILEIVDWINNGTPD